MTPMLALTDKDFKAAIIKAFQQSIKTLFNQWEKKKIFAKKM